MKKILSNRGVFFLFLSVFIIMAAATPFLWATLDQLLKQEKQILWESVEKTLGQRIVYDKIGSNFMEALELQNVRILADNGEVLFRAAAIRLHLDWGAVLSGHPGDLLDKIQVINAAFDLNEQRDQKFLGRVGELIRGNPMETGIKKSQAAGRPIKLEGFNISGNWTGAAGKISLERIFFLLDDVENEYRMRLRGGFSVHLNQNLAGMRNLAGSFQGELRSDHQFNRLVLQGRSGKLTSELVDLAPLNFQCTLTPQSLQFTKVQDQLPLDVSFFWNRESPSVQAKFHAEKFSFDRLVTWKGGETGAQWLKTLWDGRMDFYYDLVRGDWDVNLDGHAEFHTVLLPEGSQIRGKIHGTPQTIVFDDAWFETPQIQLRFDGSLEMGSWLPDGRLSLNRCDIPGYGRLSSELHFHRSPGRTDLTGGVLNWEEVHLKNLQGYFSRDNSHFSYGLEASMDSNAAITPLLGFQGAGNWADGRFPVQFHLSQVAFAPFLRSIKRIGIPLETSDEVQALAASASGEMVWDSVKGWSLNPSDISFQDPQRPDHEGHFKMKFLNQILSIAEIGFHWGKLALGGQAQLDFSSNKIISWTSDWDLFGNNYGLNGVYDYRQRKLTWAGSAGLEGEFRLKGPKEWFLQVRAEGLKLPGQGKLDFLCSANGGSDQWASELAYLKWQGNNPLTQKPSEFLCHGTLTSQGINMDHIRWSDNNGVVKGQLESSLDLSFSKPWKGQLNLQGEKGESYVGQWMVNSFQDFSLQIQLQKADIRRFGDSPLHGGFDLSLAAVMTKEKWLWNADFQLNQAVWIKDPISLRFKAQGDGNTVSFHDVDFYLNPLKIQAGQGTLDWSTGTWDFQFLQTLPLGTGTWKSLMVTQGKWQDEGAGESVKALLISKDNLWNGKPLGDWKLEGEWDQNQWTIGLKDGDFKATGTNDGRLSIVGQGNFPLKMTAEGNLRDGILDLNVQNIDFDLPLLFKAVNTEYFSVSSGHLLGGFQIKGPLNDLEFWGNPIIEKLTFHDMFVRADVGPFDCPLDFQGKRLAIPEVNGGPEGQYWMISGSVLLDHVVPEKYDLKVRTLGLSMVPAEYKMTGIHAVGWLTGVFTLEGNLNSLTLGGNLTLQDTSIIMVPDDLKNSAPASGDYFGVNADMTFISGRRLEFLWPSQDVPLVRTVAQPAQQLSVKVDEAHSTFHIDGKIDLRAGEINYLSNYFVIREGRLTFQEDQNSFDPRLKVRAELKKRDSDGNIIINLRADNRISSFTPTFDSTPYMSLEDIQILLGSPITGAGGSQGVAASLASNFGSGYLLHPVENFIKKILGLDLFSLQTDLVKKTLLSGNGGQDASSYLDNTHVYFGKYVGDDVFIQGIFSFRQDYPVYGRQETRLVMEPELQLEFQTPLYLLVWSLQPQHYDETMFVSDSTVTFRWNWSY